MVFRRQRQADKRQGDAPIFTEPVFVELLERERLRAERTLRTFCLLHIGEDSLTAHLATVAGRLDDKVLRRTDAAGWFRRGIGVMLPETELAGAEQVRDKLCEGLDIVCRIYVFPADHLLPEREADGTEDEPIERAEDLVLIDSLDRDGSQTESTADSTPQPEPQPLEALMTIDDSWGKRAIDVVGAGAGLLLLSPLILLAMLLVKLTSQGPVFFTQLRAGQGGRPFRMFKLRTMIVNAEQLQASLRAASEQDGPAFKMRRDPRITWIGRYLRKSCIDELPQLWNVLRGEMSLVGPRPLPLSESAQISQWARGRLRVKPGLTCIWQVEGGAHVKFTDWMRMDLRYVQRRTLLHDLQLIVRTAANVLLHRAST